MMARGLYKNVIVDIPETAHLVRSTGRVYIIIDQKYSEKDKRVRPVELVIGKAFSNTQMYPNKNYSMVFTSSFEEAAHMHVPTHCKRIGMYAAILSVAERNGLYHLLIDHYGIQSANMLMDFCSYSIQENTSVAEHYPETMADQVLFSEKAFDDSWISTFFERILSENDTAQFKKAWAMHCRELGVKDVWLCIDGSNNDCDIRDAEYAENGKNKTHTNKPVVGFMYAISALDGLPVTYSVFRGSRVDSRQIYLMVDYLKSYDMQISGVILDRGFASIECMRLMYELKYPFIIMLKEGTYGIRTLFAKYGETINMAFEHCVDNDGKIFGIVEKTQVFKQYPDTAYVGLFYDSENGTARASHLIKKIKAAQKKMEHAIGNGDQPVVPKGMSKYLKPYQDVETKQWLIYVDIDSINRDLKCKGYSGIATSENITAMELNDCYSLRNASEKQYALLKTQLDDHVLRTHFNNGLYSKMAVGFIASIIRHQLMQVALSLGMNTNSLVRELNLLEIHHLSGNTYFYSRTASEKQKDILHSFGLSEHSLELLALRENVQGRSPEKDPVSNLPEAEPKKKNRGRPKGSQNKTKPSADNENQTLKKRSPGRPKGSKNKKTILREAEEAKLAEAGQPSPKRGKGRPKGSKNKATIEREAKEAVLRAKGLLPEKRKPGRPKGSKNKRRDLES